MPIWRQKQQRRQPRYNKLSDQIKTAEKRMARSPCCAPISVNYAKTHETYVAYRKPGIKEFRRSMRGNLAAPGRQGSLQPS